MGEQPSRRRARRTSKKPTVFCVDDEPFILEGLEISLRKHFTVRTAPSGQSAIQLLEADTNPAVIISDMRMPGMDGAAFLNVARRICPDAVRILLTGHADIEAAIRAVNDGSIFHYLTKPCPIETLKPILDDAVELYERKVEERVALEETFWSSVEMLMDVLSLVAPESYGRTDQIQKIVKQALDHLDLPHRWEFETAAALSQIGCATVPTELIKRFEAGAVLSEDERRHFWQHPQAAKRMLSRIPRLEGVAQMVSRQFEDAGDVDAETPLVEEDRVDVGSRILRASLDLYRLTRSGSTRGQAVSSMSQHPTRYDPRILAALDTVSVKLPEIIVRVLPVAKLKSGMMLDDDVHTKDGLLIASAGRTVTEATLARLERFEREGRIHHEVQVRIVRSMLDLLDDLGEEAIDGDAESEE